MGLVLELVILFVVIFFAVRLAVTGHVDRHKASEPQKHELVYQKTMPVS
jgi:hypothetical protein